MPDPRPATAWPLFIHVYGRPAPQGSKRAFAVRKNGQLTGRAAVIESSHDRLKSWRQAVIDAAREALAAGSFPGPAAGPLTVTMTFWFTRPRGHYGTGRNYNTVRPSAPPRPAGPPDLSKLVRATEDALTDAGVWGSDAQVVACRAAKWWTDSQAIQGAQILVAPWDGEEP